MINKPITQQVLSELQQLGYTMLIAEGQADQDKYIFTPQKQDVDEFTNNHLTSDLEDDMILVIEQILEGFSQEDFEGHEIIIP